MAEVIVTLPEGDLPKLTALLSENGFEHHTLDAESIPEWQKEEVRQSKAETKPENYIAWEQVRAEL